MSFSLAEHLPKIKLRLIKGRMSYHAIYSIHTYLTYISIYICYIQGYNISIYIIYIVCVYIHIYMYILGGMIQSVKINIRTSCMIRTSETAMLNGLLGRTKC